MTRWDGRHTERRPGRPPWVPTLRLPTVLFAGLIAVVAVSAVVSVGVALWQLVDHASDPR